MSAEQPTVGGMTIDEWREEMPWWPNGTEARIHAGQAGHDREIVVNFDAYDHEHPVNDIVEQCLVALLPAHWKCENRSTRIELHPTGRLFGGFTEQDVAAVCRALGQLGFKLGTVEIRINPPR